MIPLGALGRYAQRPRPAPVADPCDLCAAPAGEPHRHLVDLVARRVCCACATCGRLFVDPAAGARYRTIPERVRFAPGLALEAAEWSRLEIPVGLAFVLRSSAAGRWVALYPGPAGVTESELPLDAWEELAARHPLLAAAEPDVEALLVHGERGSPAMECFLVPIDVAYGLAGRIRRRWRGLDGGDAVRGEIAAFFEALRAGVRP